MERTEGKLLKRRTVLYGPNDAGLKTRLDFCLKRLEMMAKFSQAKIEDLIVADMRDLGHMRTWTLELGTEASLGNYSHRLGSAC